MSTKKQGYAAPGLPLWGCVFASVMCLFALWTRPATSAGPTPARNLPTTALSLQHPALFPFLPAGIRQANQSRLPTTPQHFFLPGTQPGGLDESIPDPKSCDTCHTAAIYDRWQGSMMANAGRDPIFWAAVAVANNDAAFSGEFCIRCHTPGGWLAGRSHPSDGTALTNLDIRSGVACEVCHRMVDPSPASPSASDQARTIDAAIRAALTTTVPITNIGSGMLILDPSDNRRGPFNLSATAPHSAYQTDFLGQSTNAVTESRLCGTCHNIDNPTLVWTEKPPNNAPPQFWPKASAAVTAGEFYPIESTYDEWLHSEYAQKGVFAPNFAGAKPDGIVASCQDCHMPRTTGKAADVGSAVSRDCQTTGCLPEHTLVGGNTWAPQLLQNPQWRLADPTNAKALNATAEAARWMLQKSATVTATLLLSGTNKLARVRVINQTGHKLPTGYAEGRRMWLNLKAFNGAKELIYESGVYQAATGELTKDSASKTYEVEQGLTPEMAQLVGLPAGASFHFVLNNTVVKDNRIPPRGYTIAAYDQPGLRPIGAAYADGQYWDDTDYLVPDATVSIQATLYYQTTSKEYIDFLRAQGGADGVTLGKLWDNSKSPPETVALAFYPVNAVYLPLITR